MLPSKWKEGLWLIWECLVPLEQPLSKQCLESPAIPRQWEQSLDLETMAEDSGPAPSSPLCVLLPHRPHLLLSPLLNSLAYEGHELVQ